MGLRWYPIVAGKHERNKYLWKYIILDCEIKKKDPKEKTDLLER